MKPITIQTRKKDCHTWEAWELGSPKSNRSTSTITGESAAINFAAKHFFGSPNYGNCLKVKLTRVRDGIFRGDVLAGGHQEGRKS